jgi:hypothetical protein
LDRARTDFYIHVDYIIMYMNELKISQQQRLIKFGISYGRSSTHFFPGCLHKKYPKFRWSIIGGVLRSGSRGFPVLRTCSTHTDSCSIGRAIAWSLWHTNQWPSTRETWKMWNNIFFSFEIIVFVHVSTHTVYSFSGGAVS